MHWINVLRDVALLYFLVVVGSLALQAMAGPEGLSVGTTVLSAVVLTSAGFTVSGVLAAKPRLPHLAAVLVVAWLVGLGGLVLFDVGFVEWLLSLPFLVVCLILGGGLAYILPRPRDSARGNEYLD